jgi:hypothetical protein
MCKEDFVNRALFERIRNIFQIVDNIGIAIIILIEVYVSF